MNDGLKVGKEHVRGKTFRAVVFDPFDPDARTRILYRAEGIGWTKHWRAECQRWIDELPGRRLTP